MKVDSIPMSNTTRIFTAESEDSINKFLRINSKIIKARNCVHEGNGFFIFYFDVEPLQEKNIFWDV